MTKQKKVKKVSRKLDFPLNTIVLVEWEDACSLTGWDDENVYKEHTVMPVQSTGFLLKKDKHYTTLITNQAIDRSLNQGIAIPTAWVRHIRVLCKGKKC